MKALIDNKIEYILLSKLIENPENVRIKPVSDGEIIILAENIYSQGLLQPVIVNQDNIVVAGNNRFRAYKWLFNQYGNEYSKIKAIRIHTKNNYEILEYNLLENLSRKNLSPEERSQAILNLRRIYENNPTDEILEISHNIRKQYAKDIENQKKIEAAINIYLSKCIGISRRRIQQIIKESRNNSEALSVALKSPLKVTHKKIIIDMSVLEDKLGEKDLDEFKNQLGYLLVRFDIN